MLTRILLISHSLFLFAAEPSLDGVIASVTVNQSLLSQIEITGRKTQPFVKHGTLQTPSIDLKAELSFGDGNQSALTQLGFSVNGTTSSHTSQNVGIRGRRRVDVNVTGHVTGNYTQDILINRDGVNGGSIRGGNNVSTSISVSNNRRLLNGVVNNIAHQQASGIVAGYLPGDKRDADAETRAALTNNFSEMQKSVQETLGKVNSLSPTLQDAPYGVRFSSQSGPKGSMNVAVSEKGKTKERNPPPKLEQEGQAATKMLIHEDLLTESMGRELAGKEIKVRDLPKFLCSKATQRFLNFCKEKPSAEAENLSIVFAKENPLKVQIKDGKIQMTLNAVYRLNSKKKAEETGSTLLQDPGDNADGYETLPYQIDVAYELQKGGAKLTQLRVHDQAPSLLEQAGAGLAGLFGLGNHEKKDEEKPKRSIADQATDLVFRTKLEGALSGVLKPEFKWPTIELPTKTQLNESGKKMTAEVKEKGSLLPLEAKAEDGWIAFSNYLCAPSMPSLGVTFQSIPWGKGRNALWIKTVVKGSPADLAGLKAGDVIDTFGSKESTLNSSDYSPFMASLGETAKKESTEERAFAISGQDSKGTRFSKSVALCPKK